MDVSLEVNPIDCHFLIMYVSIIQLIFNTHFFRIDAKIFLSCSSTIQGEFLLLGVVLQDQFILSNHQVAFTKTDSI
jgi:hypothetical protein